MPLQAKKWLDSAILEDLSQVERILEQGVGSSLAVPQELSKKLVAAGGKRIRPYLMCLTHRSIAKSAITGPSPRGTLQDLYTLAAVAEWVHTATLFHDDVLDSSPTRREMPAAHTIHGNKVAILVGDFVYAEAFNLLMDRGLLAPSKALAVTIKRVVEGELVQHKMVLDRSLSEAEYHLIAQAKTASLFAWCTETGAWISGIEEYSVAREFGLALGHAFQMADDLIDTFEDGDVTTWCESAPPLPIVLAAKRSREVARLWSLIPQQDDPASLAKMMGELQSICREPKLIEDCLNMIESRLNDAQSKLQILGAVNDLSWAIGAIWQRALEGAALSRQSLQGFKDFELKFQER
jgi:octaprenyl-diphosphate synthase